MSAILLALSRRPRLVLFGAAAIVAIGLYLTGRGDGADAVTRRITEQNERAEDTALQAERDVAACIGGGGFWDVTTGTCR